MYIKEIEFMNFRFFKKTKYCNFSNFNIIIGDNGIGKTSFIKGLNVLMAAFFDPIKYTAKHYFEKHDIRINYDDMNPKYSPNVAINGIIVINNNEFIVSRNLEKKGKRTQTIGNEFIIEVKKIQEGVLNKEVIDLPVLVYYPATRDSNEVTIPLSSSIADFLKIKNPSVNYKDFLVWYEHQIRDNERFIGYYNSTKPTTNYQFFLHWFKKISLEANTSVAALNKLNFVRTQILKSLDNFKEVLYSEKYDIILLVLNSGTIIPINRLSDGYKRNLSIIGDIAFRCISLNPHLNNDANKSKGIVLIDEIDLHLHPTWQKEIINDLTDLFPNLQFFASTHSPFIIQELNNGTLIELSKENAISINSLNYSIEDIAEEIQGVENPQWSKKRIRMYEAASEYYRLLNEYSNDIKKEDLERLKIKLDELTKPFADNLAYVALLEQQRLVAELQKMNK